MDNNLKTSNNSSLNHIKSKIKLVFLGDQSTGKTSILLRFIHDKFQSGQGATIGIDFMSKNLSISNYHLRLQLWDTAGQQRFRSLIPSYLKDAGLAIIVYDISNKRSFENVRQWIDLCNQNKKQKSVIVLVGNKIDLQQERSVSFDEASQLAITEGILYFEVSAKSSSGVEQMFQSATEQYIKQNFNNSFLSEVVEVIQKDQSKMSQKSANKVIQKDQSKISQKPAKNFELNAKPIIGGPGNKKISGCC